MLIWRSRNAVAAVAVAILGVGAAAAVAYGYPSSWDDRAKHAATTGNADTRSAGADVRPFTEEEAAAVAERLAQGAGHHVRVPDILAELGGDSFAGLRTEEGGRRIASYWAGEIPIDVERYAASEPEGVTIELLPAEFSRKRLSEAATRITGNSDLVRRVGVSWVSPGSDGSGLEIGLDGAEPAEAVKAEIAALAGLPDSTLRYAPHSAFVNVPGTTASPPASDG